MSCGCWSAAITKACGGWRDDRIDCRILETLPVQRWLQPDRVGHDLVVAGGEHRDGVLPVVAAGDSAHLALGPVALAGSTVHLRVSRHAAVYPVADLLQRDLRHRGGAFATVA